MDRRRLSRRPGQRSDLLSLGPCAQPHEVHPHGSFDYGQSDIRGVAGALLVGEPIGFNPVAGLAAVFVGILLAASDMRPTGGQGAK